MLKNKKKKSKAFRLSNLPEDVRVIYRRYNLIKIVCCAVVLLALIFSLISGSGIKVGFLVGYVLILSLPAFLYKKIALNLYQRRKASEVFEFEKEDIHE